MEFPHLSKAPIKEAIIDIQGLFAGAKSEDEVLRQLLSGHKELSSLFPRSELRVNKHLQIGHTGDAAKLSETKLGYFFRNESNTEIVQYRINGFSFSYVNKYPEWKDFCDKTKGLFSSFLKVRENFVINRIATRFINEIQVPYPLDELHLKHVNSIPSGENISILKSFTEQHNWTDSVTGNRVNLIKIMQEPLKGATQATVVVDIDVSREISEVDANSSRLWELIHSFQEVKNKTFFSIVGKSIQEKYK